MNQQGHSSPGYYLNRIAASYNGDPVKTDPIIVLKAFFDYAERGEQIKAFDDYCRAALKDDYSWQHGSPANALHYGERLELLVEAAYLLHQQADRFKGRQPAAVAVPLSEFPMLLTAKEFTDPVRFLATFFAKRSLHEWKKLLSLFTAAAISNGSVTEEIDAADIFECISCLKKLVYVASRLVALQAGEAAE